MEDVPVKLNLGFLWKKLHSTRSGIFYYHVSLKIEEKLVKCYIWSMVLYGAETLSLRAADQKYLES
jgi:hypothetical protein